MSALISVRVRPEIAERLKALAETLNCSSSCVAAQALEGYLDLHEWQIQAIQEGIAAVENNEVVSFENMKQNWKKKCEDLF